MGMRDEVVQAATDLFSAQLAVLGYEPDAEVRVAATTAFAAVYIRGVRDGLRAAEGGGRRWGKGKGVSSGPTKVADVDGPGA